MTSLFIFKTGYECVSNWLVTGLNSFESVSNWLVTGYEIVSDWLESVSDSGLNLLKTEYD